MGAFEALLNHAIGFAGGICLMPELPPDQPSFLACEQHMNLPLFPADEISLEDRLRTIFQSWVESRAGSRSGARSERALKEESARVYQEMWHAFAAHCASRNLDINDIDADGIQAFLAMRGSADTQSRTRASIKGEDLSPRYAWRMLTLIDRVTRFHAKHSGVQANQAAQEVLKRPEYRYANAAHRDTLPEYFCETHARKLIAYLTQADGTDIAAGRLPWKEVRDRTAVALMMGGGLAPGDIRAMKLSGVIADGGHVPGVPWKLSVPGNGNAPARETPLSAWAGRQLASWLSVREGQQIAGDLVFTSTLGGRALSHTACYEACKAVLAGAGFGNDAGGVFKLRHTFALRQLAKGKSESEVAQWLGFVDPGSMARYRRVVPQYVDVV